MAEPAAFQLPLEGQLALLSRVVEDSELVQAAVASGHASSEQLHELLAGAAWDEHRVEAAVDTAIDRGLVLEHALGRVRVVEWTR